MFLSSTATASKYMESISASSARLGLNRTSARIRFRRVWWNLALSNRSAGPFFLGIDYFAGEGTVHNPETNSRVRAVRGYDPTDAMPFRETRFVVAW